MLSYQKLEAWKKGMEIVKEAYLISKSFPPEEIYALTSQVKRAAVSVPSNVAEGLGRNYKKGYYTIFSYCKGIFLRVRDFIKCGKNV